MLKKGAVAHHFKRLGDTNNMTFKKVEALAIWDFEGVPRPK